MPRFYQEVDAEIDIEADEFLSYCSGREIERVIKWLSKNGHITGLHIGGRISNLEQEHIDYCNKLASSFHRLTNEECETLHKISNRL
jgi:hypothetical protein